MSVPSTDCRKQQPNRDCANLRDLSSKRLFHIPLPRSPRHHLAADADKSVPKRQRHLRMDTHQVLILLVVHRLVPGRPGRRHLLCRPQQLQRASPAAAGRRCRQRRVPDGQYAHEPVPRRRFCARFCLGVEVRDEPAAGLCS